MLDFTHASTHDEKKKHLETTHFIVGAQLRVLLFFVEGIMIPTRTVILWMLLTAVIFLILVPWEAIGLKGKGEKLNGVVMVRNAQGELCFSLFSSTRIKHRNGMLSFKGKDGKRMMIFQGKHGYILQAER